MLNPFPPSLGYCSYTYYPLPRADPRGEVREGLPLLLAGRGEGHEVGLGGGPKLLQEVLHGQRGHHQQGREHLDQGHTQADGHSLHLDRYSQKKKKQNAKNRQSIVFLLKW